MITLRKVDRKNVWKLLRLKVNENQEDFVATNNESIIEAYIAVTSGGTALPFGIYNEDEPVGFLMIGYDDLPDDENPSVARGNYCIWRLMIDRSFQGRGYARQAMRAALDYIRTFPCGPAKYCWLSYEPENAVAAKLYHQFGFVENGEYDDDEIVSVLPL